MLRLLCILLLTLITIARALRHATLWFLLTRHVTLTFATVAAPFLLSLHLPTFLILMLLRLVLGRLSLRLLRLNNNSLSLCTLAPVLPSLLAATCARCLSIL